MSLSTSNTANVQSLGVGGLLECPEHPGENLQRVCLVSGCPQALLCPQCMQSNNGHLFDHQKSLVSFGTFRKWVREGIFVDKIEEIRGRTATIQKLIDSLRELQDNNSQAILEDIANIKRGIVRQIDDYFEQISISLIRKSESLNQPLLDRLTEGLEATRRTLDFLTAENERDLSKADLPMAYANLKSFRQVCSRKVAHLNTVEAELRRQMAADDFQNWVNLNFGATDPSRTVRDYFVFYDHLVDPLFPNFGKSLNKKTENFLVGVGDVLLGREWPVPRSFVSENKPKVI